jgi:hypothetical protein
MEPITNTPDNSTEPEVNNPGSNLASLNPVNNDSSQITLRGLQESQQQDSNNQIIENLKEQRDILRGTQIEEAGEKPKRKTVKKIALLLILFALLAGVFTVLIRPRLNNQNEDASLEQLTQKAFVLPADLSSKTSEEKNALNVINLARKNDATAIINTYLNKAQLGQSEADFTALIASYSSSVDGESVELIEKKVGKVDFASAGETSVITETTSIFEAASLIYKSDYFRHTNNIYLKINLYKPDPSVDAWKVYIFEYKTGDAESPLKAEIEIPI